MALALTMTEKQRFAERLSKLRERHGLTQIQLGKMVGVTGTCVWNWEGGNTFPRPAALNKLAEALGTSVEYLGSGKEPSPGGNQHGPGAHRPLSEIIMEARQRVAQAAGVPVSNVRIVLDLGD